MEKEESVDTLSNGKRYRELSVTGGEFLETLRSFMAEGFNEYTPANKNIISECIENFVKQDFEIILVECMGDNSFYTIFYRKPIVSSSLYIYTYLRADREEIDMGPYLTKTEAEFAKRHHASFGALTSGSFEKPLDYKLYKGED